MNRRRRWPAETRPIALLAVVVLGLSVTGLLVVSGALWLLAALASLKPWHEGDVDYGAIARGLVAVAIPAAIALTFAVIMLARRRDRSINRRGIWSSFDELLRSYAEDDGK